MTLDNSNEDIMATPTAEAASLSPQATPPVQSGPVAAPRESASRYSLMRTPTYENIVGGAAPSPVVSLILLIGLASLLGAAAGTALGVATIEWWLLGALFTVIAVTLAAFISRRA